MNKSIFRKTSLDRVNSPEQLNEYIRVAAPGVWLVLVGMALLLAGFVVWGIFGKLETAKNVEVVSSEGKLVCYINTDNADAISEGMTVTVDGYRGVVLSVSDMPVELSDDTDPYLLFIGGYSAGDFAYTADIAVDGLPDGVYNARVITESISPISFIIQ